MFYSYDQPLAKCTVFSKSLIIKMLPVFLLHYQARGKKCLSFNLDSKYDWDKEEEMMKKVHLPLPPHTQQTHILLNQTLNKTQSLIQAQAGNFYLTLSIHIHLSFASLSLFNLENPEICLHKKMIKMSFCNA